MDVRKAQAELAELAEKHPALRLLVLHGSRARGDARPGSDWDLAYLAEPGFDANVLLGEAMIALATDHVDLADLSRAGGLLRYRTARDGVAVFERPPGAFDDFALDAITFWCDAEPILRRAYEHVLEDLGS